MYDYETTLANSRNAIRYFIHNPERINDPAIIPFLRTSFHLHEQAAIEVLDAVRETQEACVIADQHNDDPTFGQ